MAKKPDPLSALLAASFKASEPTRAPAATHQESPAAPPATAPAATPSRAGDSSPSPVKTRAPRKPKPAPAPEPPAYEFEACKKTTVSFYATEQAKVDDILDTLLKVRRHRGGFSDAIKIALRLCPTDPQSIASAWDHARAADKRTQRTRRP